ncbi:MAG: DUF5615 family PIN-like protein [Bacteroidota bacterium]
MKLLFDQNISFRLIKKISSLFPEAVSVKEVGLENSADSAIWNYAIANDFAIVTFDSDFYELNILKKPSPKIIWLRTGNTSTDNLVKLFTDKSEVIHEFLSNEIYSDIDCLEIE